MRTARSLMVFLLGLAVVGPALAASGTATDAEISGRVVDDDGDAVANALVLVEAANESFVAEQTRDRDVADSLRKLAHADPDGMWVAETDADGRYSRAVPSGEYTVVTVAGERVSHRHALAISGEHSRNLTVARNHVLSLQGTSAEVRPDETATVSLTVPNADDETVRNLTIDLAVDAALSVVSVDASGGTVTNGTVRFDSLAPGQNATVTVSARAVADTGRTTADVDAAAWSDTHFVDATTGASVAIRPEGSTPTQTALPGGNGDGSMTESSTPVDTGTNGDMGEPASPTPTEETGPGFGILVAVAATLVAGLLARRVGARTGKE